VPSGSSWRYLVLPPREKWEASSAVLLKLESLVAAGATILGPEPGPAPGWPAKESWLGADQRQAAGKLWSGLAQAGRVSWEADLESVFALDRLQPDFSFTPEALGNEDRVRLDFIHRRMNDGADAYFVLNHSERAGAARCIFRVATSRAPELWNPVSGERRFLNVYESVGDRTEVPLEFLPYESMFVVFGGSGRQASGVGKEGELNFPRLKTVGVLKGPWEVRFDPAWGGPKEPVSLTELQDWTENPDPGIRYYSGSAAYSTTFDLPAGGGPLVLDLGKVEIIASVRVNGVELGDVWCAPWQVRLPPERLKATENRIEISVANLWVNRMLRDASLPKEQRLTSTEGYWWLSKEKAPRPSGLLGPVVLKGPMRG